MECFEQTSVNQQKQQQINRALVIRLLRRSGICSRAALSRHTGLKRATITNIIGELIQSGLVVENGHMEGEKGRRAMGVRLNGARYRVIGVTITRTGYNMGLIGVSGEVYREQKHEFPEGTDAETVISDLCIQMREMIGSCTDARVLAVGIAIPGPYVEVGGEIAFVTNSPGWDGIPIYSRLQEQLDVPVFVENDANAGALAQLWYAPQQQAPLDLAYIVAGQGIGCGILAGGHLVKGSTGIAGEIGHTTIRYDGPPCACGNRGCLEMYCSTLVLQKNLRELVRQGKTAALQPGFSMADVAAAIAAGDSAVCEAYDAVCRYLAVGIVNIVNQFDPGMVIIGDTLAELAPARMLQVVREQVKERIRPMIWEHLDLRVSELRHSPILLGAAMVASLQVFEDISAYVNV